jgi:hypothetical protein
MVYIQGVDHRSEKGEHSDITENCIRKDYKDVNRPALMSDVFMASNSVFPCLKLVNIGVVSLK